MEKRSIEKKEIGERHEKTQSSVTVDCSNSAVSAMAKEGGGRKVRVIAKIRGAIKTPSPNRISVSNSSSICFVDNKREHTYQLDNCYEPNDDNSTIFSAEIKPLISFVFGGHSATVVAFGATASGKSYTIQGSDANPGLAVLAVEQFLLMADKAAMSVAISCYEVYQDQVYDLINKTDNAVSVLENAQGKIQLKGLSQTLVKSMVDFQNLYLHDSHRKTQKLASQPSGRSHKGLIIHLLSHNENSNAKPSIGTMNFVDLAGFGDPRRKSLNTYTLAENSRINKSLYALQSVVYALNRNDSRVPYRDSKLTYMLRDSLSGTNKILMIACLNPNVCQDTIYMANLASRCSKGNRQVFMDSLKNGKRIQKSMVTLSSRDVKKSVIDFSSKSAKSVGLKKKITSTRYPLYEKKTNITDGGALLEGSKPFDEVNHGPTVEKISAQVDIDSDTLQVPAECVSCLSDIVSTATYATQEMVSATVDNVSDMLQAAEESVSIPVDIVSDTLQALEESEKRLQIVPCPIVKVSFDEDCETDMENQRLVGHEGASPPLSARLQDLSNYLKSLQSSTPLNKDMIQDIDKSTIEPKTPEVIRSVIVTTSNNIDDAVLPKLECTNMNENDAVEPETPAANMNISFDYKRGDSPWTTFNVHSAGVKRCLTKECVRFINSASKEELKGLKGIGDKRATYIMKLREKSPEHFKRIDDLKDVGLSAKQIKMMMRNIAGDMFG